MNNNISRTCRPLIAAVMAPLFLMACGGGDGNSSGVFDAVDSNIALASKGSSTTASYDAGAAPSLIDGDRTAAASWSGNVSNDSVTIDFGRERFVRNLRLYTNSVASSAANADIEIEFQPNSGAWQTTGYDSAVDVPCNTYTAGADDQYCTFSSRIRARRIRLTITAPSIEVAAIALYELEATGY